LKTNPLLLTLPLLLAAPLMAQSTIKDALAKHWKTAGEFTIAVANAMPDDTYSFRPSPEEMSFGQLMAHLASADQGACAVASGMPRPKVPEKLMAWSKSPEKVDVSKENAVSYLKETFEFCDKAVAAMTPQLLDALAGPPARNMTGFEWLFGYFTHTAHHRAQAEVYLRVKGIKPPDYRF
jgi:uncharacterized damage-inducible protein DinB